MPTHPIQRFLWKDGNSLSDLKRDPYNLSISACEDGKLVNFKYNQIKSDMNDPICRKSRGVLLERGTWYLVAYPFDKFFNLHESQAADIDWDTATVYEKMDGTCAVLYHYDGEWRMKTLGTAMGEGDVQGTNFLPDGVKTFNDLFWHTWDIVYPDYNDPDEVLESRYTYMFELCTKYNQIVKMYEEPRIVILGARDMATHKEVGSENFEGIFDTPKKYSLSTTSPSKLKAMIDMLPYDEEGYVVRDANFERIKMKNPAYVSAHKVKDQVASRSNGILELIFANEVDDFIGIFPEYEDRVREVIDGLNELERRMEEYYQSLNGDEVDPDNHEERKTFALSVQQFEAKAVMGLFFQRLTGQIESFEEGLKQTKPERVEQAISNIVQ